MSEDTLLARTYRLLDVTDLTYREIAAGADVGLEWLKSLAIRRIEEPGATKLERLHNFLAAHPPASRVPTPSQGLRVAGNG